MAITILGPLLVVIAGVLLEAVSTLTLTPAAVQTLGPLVVHLAILGLLVTLLVRGLQVAHPVALGPLKVLPAALSLLAAVALGRRQAVVILTRDGLQAVLPVIHGRLVVVTAATIIATDGLPAVLTGIHGLLAEAALIGPLPTKTRTLPLVFIGLIRALQPTLCLWVRVGPTLLGLPVELPATLR